MRPRPGLPAFLLLCLATVCLTGCLISSQEGERRHINAPHPDEILFHFDTTYNQVVLVGRSLVLVALASWMFSARGKSGMGLVPVALAAVLAGVAVWIFLTGWEVKESYRIQVLPEALHLEIPGGEPRTIPWTDMEGLDVRGVARDVLFAGGQGQALQWASDWKDLELTLTSGATAHIDLRPLSTEQRGTLWRAIARHAGFEWQIQVVPER